MTLHDISHGPDWVMWVTLALFIILTILFLSGKGSGLIAGYNTMTDEDKKRYDVKKLCKGTGYGFCVMDICILVMALGENVLLAWVAYAFLAVVVLDIIFMIVYGNIICKKRK